MTDRSDNERRNDQPVEKTGPGDNKNEETNKLGHRASGAFTESPAIVRAAPPTSPLRFYARLRHQLELRGLDYDRLPRLTEPGTAPPCFSRFRVSFDAWLSSASMLGATVPYRCDMPAEPNYCWDCTRELQCEAKKLGVCQFPDARFERIRTQVPDTGGRRVSETEVLGVSRPKRVDANLWEEYDGLDNSPSLEE